MFGKNPEGSVGYQETKKYPDFAFNSSFENEQKTQGQLLEAKNTFEKLQGKAE